jgi:hypothetical protein
VLLFTFLPFLLLWFGIACFHGFVCFHFLCAEFLGESFVVMAWLSYIVLVSSYHGRFFIAPSILNDHFAG